MWPAVAVELRRVLASRGVSHADADDIVQHVALRALERPPHCDHDGGFQRWANTVARNAHVDLVRRRAKDTDDDGLTLLASAHDVASQALARITLEQTVMAVGELSERDRHAIATAFDDTTPDDRNIAVREAVRRHRARTRLRQRLAHLLGWFTVLVTGRRIRPPAAALLAASAVAVATHTLSGPATDSPAPQPAPPPTSAPAALADSPTPARRTSLPPARTVVTPSRPADTDTAHPHAPARTFGRRSVSTTRRDPHAPRGHRRVLPPRTEERRRQAPLRQQHRTPPRHLHRPRHPNVTRDADD